MLEQDAHLATIERAIKDGSAPNSSEWVAASWSRCLFDHHLDPSHRNLVTLTDREVGVETERFDNDLELATTQLEQTLQIIEGGGYSAHLTNEFGVIIEDRKCQSGSYYCTLDSVGSVWTEELGGTNGIGIALLEKSPSAVYLSDHFFAEMTMNACAAAPFFRPNGELMGVINLSTRNPGIPKLAHRVIFGVAQSSAAELEVKYFRQNFRNNFTFHLTPGDMPPSPILLAVDDDFCVVGASRAARDHFDIPPNKIGASSLWGIFEKLHGGPGLYELRETLRELRPLGQRTSIPVRVFQPLNAAARKSKLIAVPPVRSVTSPPVRKAAPVETLEDCAGSDPGFQRDIKILKRLYGAGLNILLLGETGVGKDALARALHFESSRAGGPFIAFNCAAVPESLIDSELFGYVGGAFTGANKSGNAGRIVEAHRGTLFLDEIGDMPLTLQTRLLRFLENREVTPLGSGKAQVVDVQVVAATHRKLEKRVTDGLFREDLYYRLNGFAVNLPALRKREDFEEIAQNVLANVASGTKLTLSLSAIKKLRSHTWPGNIRELRNVLLRAVHMSDGPEIEDDVIFYQTLEDCPAIHEVEDLGAELENQERAELIRAIEAGCRDASSCADCLKISRATLYRKLKKHGLSLK